MDRPRSCVRPGCAEPPVCTLTYNYGARVVFLDDLLPREVGGMDHCLAHAGRLRAPLGWAIEDRRSTILPLRRDLAS